MQILIVGFFNYLIIFSVFKSVIKFQCNPVGYACILLLKAILPVECAPSCDITSNSKKVQIVNCSSRELLEIPQDLSPETSILDLSSNKFSSLRENSFKRYSALTVLLLKNVSVDLEKVDLYLFRPLKNLDVINLHGSSFSSKAYFYWPTTLRIINIVDLKLDDIDLSQLKNLEILYAKNNKLTEFPIVHELVNNLTYVDLDGNPLESLSPERLAPLCGLRTLHLQIDEQSRFLQSFARYCLCKRTNLWATNFKIAGHKLACDVPPYGDQCDDTFSDDTLSMYNECVERNKKSKVLIIVLVLAVLVILVLGGSAAGYYYYVTKIKPDSKKDSGEPKQEDDFIGKHGSSKEEPAEVDLDENAQNESN